MPHSLSAMENSSAVPLAWRNLVSNKPRLLRSLAGIAFATLLMMTEIAFYNGFVGSNLLPIRSLDGDIMLVGSTKYEFARSAPLSRRQLYQARSMPGVASVRPLYVKRLALWRNPQNLKLFDVQVFAFDPDQPVFLLPELNAYLDDLRQPDTVIVDRRARTHVGVANTGTETELTYRGIRVVGTFWLGPNFSAHGTVLMSDWTFLKVFGSGTSNFDDLANLDIAVVKLQAGENVSSVQEALRSIMPDNVATLTKSELIDRESKFVAQFLPVGPVFGIGTLVGFAVGMLISYQILFSELSDQLPQYATLTAMGYQGGYLIKIVLQQAFLYAILGYVPAWMLCYPIFHLMSDMALIPMTLSVELTAISFAFTVAMCIGAALIAVRRVIAADPAELVR
jgi:putative ABC transport system permease protein